MKISVHCVCNDGNYNLSLFKIVVLLNRGRLKLLNIDIKMFDIGPQGRANKHDFLHFLVLRAGQKKGRPKKRPGF